MKGLICKIFGCKAKKGTEQKENTWTESIERDDVIGRPRQKICAYTESAECERCGKRSLLIGNRYTNIAQQKTIRKRIDAKKMTFQIGHHKGDSFMSVGTNK